VESSHRGGCPQQIYSLPPPHYGTNTAIKATSFRLLTDAEAVAIPIVSIFTQFVE